MNTSGKIVRAAMAAAVVMSPSLSRADVFSNVPEASGYQLVYTLPIGNGNSYASTGVPYSVNNAGSIADNSFSRVGYYLELQSSAPGSQLQYVYASFDAADFSRNAGRLGVPTAVSGVTYQQTVSNMNVVSNVPSITKGTGITTGNVEFWPSNYSTNNAAGIPNANSSLYDFGDEQNPGSYGSMQIHNYGASQTLFAFNNWNGGGGDLGIGNNTTIAGNGAIHPDWTFTNTTGSFTVKNLQIVVGGAALPPPPPPPPAGPRYMPLGDSITEGAGAAGGYRTKLYQDLSAADPSHKPDLIGNNTSNASTILTNAGEINHEGHGGYRIDQIASGLGTNGNGWFNAGIDPNFVLLHIGTNDILQNFDVGVGAANMANRLDALVNQITTDRPNANLMLASIIPINNSSNTTVQQYNAIIKDLIVPKYDALGKHVYFVDQYSNFVDAQGNIIASLLPDAVHPNQTGYDLMGDTWAASIQAVPEPSTFIFFAAAAVGLLNRRPRSRRDLDVAA